MTMHLRTKRLNSLRPATTFVALLALVSTALLSTVALAELPHITNVRINPTPPGAKVSAAYLDMHNLGGGQLSLSGVSSPAIPRVEIHLSELVDDVARMRKQDSVELDAGERVTFKHGGLHVMLMGLEAPLVPGDEIPLVFHTSQGDITINARVAQNIELPDDSNHGDMGHDSINHDPANPDSMGHDQMSHEKPSDQSHR